MSVFVFVLHLLLFLLFACFSYCLLWLIYEQKVVGSKTYESAIFGL